MNHGEKWDAAAAAAGAAGGSNSILTRRLGLIIGSCTGSVVFIILVSILSYLKIKKQRQVSNREQPTQSPEFITFRLILYTGKGRSTDTNRSDVESCRCSIHHEHQYLQVPKIYTAGHNVCICDGIRFDTLPDDLPQPLWAVHITNSEITLLPSNFFSSYKHSLRDIAFSKMRKLEIIEMEAFNGFMHLRTIDISGAPRLRKLAPDLFLQPVTGTNFKTIRIVHCAGLERIPRLIAKDGHDERQPQYALHSIDLESNNFLDLPSHTFQIASEQVLLGFNGIKAVEDFAFDGSEIAKLSLRGNRRLGKLSPFAFSGITSLRILDLSMTAISWLPTSGLNELEVLILEDTHTLKVFPSVYNFKSIQETRLTYPYHCCAFKFPEMHSPLEYVEHENFMRRMQLECEKMKSDDDLVKKISRQSRSFGNKSDWGDWHRHRVHSNQNLSLDETLTEVSKMNFEDEDGMFHQIDVTIGPPIHVICGNLTSKNYLKVKCSPRPDAFSPCEDLMGTWALRIAVWFVGIFSLFGNFAVLIVLISSNFRMTVPKFLMCNLAVADFCMGLYLILIATMDIRSVGFYFNFAIDWQTGIGCKVAGFLTVFASELSVFTLAVITCERWYTITYAIHLNKRLKLGTATNIMFAGWFYSIVMAALPLIGVSSYSKTSICLPLESRSPIDVTYLVTLLLFNAIAFVLICACYGRMYVSIGINRQSQQSNKQHQQVQVEEDKVQAQRSDLTVAKRMALLVFTDFACWAPITFFGITALLGYPLIDVPSTKILLVFFYPLNSCANPYLYALLTQQYRRDLFILLSRYGICGERAARYKGVTVTSFKPVAEHSSRYKSKSNILSTSESGKLGSKQSRRLMSRPIQLEKQQQQKKKTKQGELTSTTAGHQGSLLNSNVWPDSDCDCDNLNNVVELMPNVQMSGCDDIPFLINVTRANDTSIL